MEPQGEAGTRCKGSSSRALAWTLRGGSGKAGSAYTSSDWRNYDIVSARHADVPLESVTRIFDHDRDLRCDIVIAPELAF
jgi:hypothetical protein